MGEMSDQNRLPSGKEEPESTAALPDRPAKALSPAAQRALAEAEARRAELAEAERSGKREIGGRGGKDPARYGDWEVKGIAVDF